MPIGSFQPGQINMSAARIHASTSECSTLTGPQNPLRWQKRECLLDGGFFRSSAHNNQIPVLVSQTLQHFGQHVKILVFLSLAHHPGCQKHGRPVTPMIRQRIDIGTFKAFQIHEWGKVAKLFGQPKALQIKPVAWFEHQMQVGGQYSILGFFSPWCPLVLWATLTCPCCFNGDIRNTEMRRNQRADPVGRFAIRMIGQPQFRAVSFL